MRMFSDSEKIQKIKSHLLFISNTGITPVFSIVISIFIVFNFGIILLGDFLQIFLWLNIASLIANFGSKEYLLRKFQEDPTEVLETWQSSLRARFPIIIVFSLLLFGLPFGLIRSTWMSLWLILRFFYLSYEPIAIWKNKNVTLLVLEVISGSIVIVLIYLWPVNITKFNLLQCFMIAEFVKVILMILINRNDFPIHIPIGVDLTQIKESLPYFLVSFVGILLLNIDQLIATLFLSSESLAFYTILMSFLLCGQLIAYFIARYKIMDLHSFSGEVISKTALRSLILGAVIVPLFILFTGTILTTFYQIDISGEMVIASFFFLLPSFYYFPFLFALYKMKEEKSVFKVNFLMVLMLCIGLPFIFSAYGIAGAMIINAVMQLYLAITFRVMAYKIF